MSAGAVLVPLASGAALALGLAVAPSDLLPAFAVGLALALPVALWVAAATPSTERRELLLLFLGAVAVRALVGVLASYATSDSFFAADDEKYSALGFELARYWAGESASPPIIYGQHFYYAWNALLFTLLGHAPLAPAFANAVAGGLATVLAFGLARDLAGPRAGLLAAGLTAFWPSLVLWSSLNLKDAFAILAILMLLRGAQRLAGGISVGSLLLLAAGLLLLTQLRSYLVGIAGIALLLGALLPRLRTSPLLTLAGAVAAAVLVSLVVPVELGDEASFEALERTRRSLAYGSSAYHGDASIGSPLAALRFLPVGLGYFLLAPVPWQLWSARQFLTLPEMLVWYALLPQVARGLVHALRTRFAATAPLASLALFVCVSYALVEGNLGTAYRHRAQVLVIFLVFAAVALARRRTASNVAEPAPAEAVLAIRPLRSAA